MRFTVLASGLAAQILSASAGTIIWDGRFNDLSSAADLENWSWENQAGPYQYYIHGDSPVSSYVELSASHKNPADSGSSQGAKITLDNTAYWNGQNMRRTELIPQTNAAINAGKVFYHFSLMRSDTNPPAETREHQIAFFESHFTELKSGWMSGAAGTSDPLLRWCIGGDTKWSTDWEAGVWHNVAYEIDFDAGTVGFWHSTGADDLVQTVAPASASTSSNGADWHVGVLELPRDGYPDEVEDLFWSGVYIETGDLTTSVSGPGGDSPGGGDEDPTSTSVDIPSTTLVTSTRPDTTEPATTTEEPGEEPSDCTEEPVDPTTTTEPPVDPTTTEPPTDPTTTTEEPAGPTTTSGGGGCTANHWDQCGGVEYTGCTVCASGFTCQYSNDWYSQCL